MAQVQNLRLRGQVYYYHRDIPKDVRHLFAGKAQVWASLKTREFQEAKRLCLQRTLEDDERMQSYRTGKVAGRILGIPAANLVWIYLNKGTHEEADRDDFDADLVESVVQMLEEVDALDLRTGR